MDAGTNEGGTPAPTGPGDGPRWHRRPLPWVMAGVVAVGAVLAALTSWWVLAAAVGGALAVALYAAALRLGARAAGDGRPGR